MDIPRQDINITNKLLEDLEEIRYIHYRDINPQIDSTNFQICTKADFKEIKSEYKNLREGWGRLKHSLCPDVFYEFKSKSGSEYFITTNGDVYRFSDHWGAVASCEWTLDGTGELRMSIMESGPLQMGVVNLKDFKIFRRKDDRRRDILINPEWQEKIKVIIPICKILHELKYCSEFKTISNDDKRLIGSSLGKFEGILKNNNIHI